LEQQRRLASAKKEATISKRAEIVVVFMDCVRELGLERASMGEVGEKIGMDRSSLYYYFKTKQELIEEAAKFLANGYVEQLHSAIARFTSTERARELVEYVFGPGFHQPKFATVMDEFNAASNRDKAIERSVAGIYRAYEDAIIQELEISYPAVPAKARRELAYTLNQLAEGVTVFSTLGFPPDRRLAARSLALRLLNELAEEDGRTSRGKGRP
jgi:AcrR family transcriptional regulator